MVMTEIQIHRVLWEYHFGLAKVEGLSILA